MAAAASLSKRTRRANSSTDAPTQYALDVVEGRIVAGPHVRDACARHLRDLETGADRGLEWHPEVAERFFRYCRVILRLNGGEFEGKPFELAPSQQFIAGSLFGWLRTDGRRRFRIAYIEQGKGNGKALAVDTPIPTPGGWTTMGALQAGDLVFDECGRVCRVLAAHPVSDDRECYRVGFDDGSAIVASAEHLWATEKRWSGAAPGKGTKGLKRSEAGAWRNGIRTTAEIAETLTYANGAYQSANHSVALAGALELPEADLPIDPYLLGAWLGDGDSDCARITIGAQDREAMLAELAAVDAICREGARGKRFRINGLQVRLRQIGLLKNKHIPAVYMRASVGQRLALLQGLLDTDGTISALGAVEFTQVDRGIAEQVHELARSLGFKATMSVGDAKLDGRLIGPKYRVCFHPREDQPVFRLARKRARQITRHSRRRSSADRRIVSCDRVDPVAVRCITVDSDSSLFLAGRAMIPTHNSPLAAAVGIYGLTADDESRAEVYAAATKKDQAQILFRDAVAMVDQSPHLRANITKSGRNPVWNLAYLRTGSFFRPIAADSAQSGPRPHIALLDEVHEHRTGLMVEMMRAGTKGRRQALIVMITNSGTNKQSICWQQHEYATRVAAGQFEDDSFFGYVCALDKDDDPFKDKSCWIKANPLIGVTIPERYIEEQVREATGMPGKESIVRRLNFCQWVDAETPWIGSDVWMAAKDDEFDEALLENRACYGGLDLSSTTDLTAFALLFEPTEADPHWRQKVWFWIPSERIEEREQRDRVPYLAWRAAGWLETTPGAAIDRRHVLAKVVATCSKYSVRKIAYDLWRIEDFIVLMNDEGATLPVEPFGQGFKSMAPAVDEYERILVSGELKHDGNPVMTWCAASAVVDVDPAGNRKVTKRKATGRVDGIVASVMAAGLASKAEPYVEPNIRWL